jgi:two-component system NtrC family sensor kinase
VSGVLAGAEALGVLRWEGFILGIPKLGSTVEAVLLSFGLSQRIKLANRQREEAQRQLVERERAEARVLEGRVAERTHDLEQALEDLRTTQDRLVKQARLASLGHLVAGVAHEIGNPLNFVVGGSVELTRRIASAEQVLAEDAGDFSREPRERASRALREALRAATLVKQGGNRIHRIVEQLRDHTRMRRELQDPIDPIVALQDTLALVEPTTERQNIRIVRDLAPVPPVHLQNGDLGQVFLNLLLNSCQAMPDGGEIRVTARSREGRVEMTFSDSGPGIAKEHRDAIFDPFFTTRLSEGTGLGLSLSQRIVEDSGGELTLLESAVGASFLVVLPCAPRPMTTTGETAG